jgi:hypothetical protein
VLSRSKKVDAKVFVSVSALKESTFKLTFSVKNTGRISFASKEIYWHVLVDRKLYIAPPSLDQDGLTVDMIEEASTTPIPIITTVKGKPFSHYKGLIDGPVFPSRQVKGLTVKVKAPSSGQHDLLYFLSTAHGLFPKSLKTDKEGNIVLETIGKIGTLPLADRDLTQ